MLEVVRVAAKMVRSARHASCARLDTRQVTLDMFRGPTPPARRARAHSEEQPQVERTADRARRQRPTILDQGPTGTSARQLVYQEREG